MNEKDLEMLTDLIDSCSISQTARRLYTARRSLLWCTPTAFRQSFW